VHAIWANAPPRWSRYNVCTYVHVWTKLVRPPIPIMWFQSLTQSSSICLCWRLLAASEDVSGGLEGGESSRWPQRFCSEEVLHLSYGSCLVYKTSPACPACLLLQGEAAVGVQLGYLENRMLSWSPGSLKKCWMDGREDFKTLFGDFDLQTLDFRPCRSGSCAWAPTPRARSFPLRPPHHHTHTPPPLLRGVCFAFLGF